jgi:hypothetical protein
MNLLARRSLAALALAALGLSLPVAARAGSPTMTPDQAVAELHAWAASTTTALAGGYRARLSIAGSLLLQEKVTAGGASAELVGPGLHAYQHGARSWIALDSSQQVRTILRYLHRPGARYVFQDQKGTKVASPVSDFAGLSATPTTDGVTPWVTAAQQTVSGSTTILALSVSYPMPDGPAMASDMIVEADAQGVVSHVSEGGGLFDETLTPAVVSVRLPSMRGSLPWSVFQKGVQAYEWPTTLGVLARLFAIDAQITALGRERDKRVHPSDIWVTAKRDLPGLIKVAPFRTRWVPIRSGVAILSKSPITGKRIDWQVVARHGSAVVVRGK